MQVNLAIIGAGPAGMAAVTKARELGLSVALLDEQSRMGGQIYRNIGQPQLADTTVLGEDYTKGANLLKAVPVTDEGFHYFPDASVWQIDKGKVFFSRNGSAQSLQADRILIATGAQERPFPIPGWTLPGVMTAGSAQVMLKSSGIAAEGAVFAGSGPLLYLIVSQYLKAGISVKAVLDTTPVCNYRHALRHWRGALQGWRYLLKGLGLLQSIRAAGVPHIRGVTALEALGQKGELEAVRYDTAKGRTTLNCEHLFLHQGVVPGTQLAMSCGCDHKWSEQQLCWQPVRDIWGQSSQPQISIAGDGSGIQGAVAAALSGELAALNIACQLGQLSTQARDQAAAPLLKALQQESAFRPFIDRLYRPADLFRKPVREDVIVCRCEETTLGELRQAAAKGCPGPNQLKSFTRCGMGSCQGRQCGLTVSELMADLSGLSVNASGHYRVRAPIKPITLHELAGLAQPGTLDKLH